MSRIAGRKTVILLAFFSVSNPIAFPPGKRYNEKQVKKRDAFASQMASAPPIFGEREAEITYLTTD